MLTAGHEAVLRQNGELDVKVPDRGWVGIGRIEPNFDLEGRKTWVVQIPHISSVWGTVEPMKCVAYRRTDAIRWAVEYIKKSRYIW